MGLSDIFGLSIDNIKLTLKKYRFNENLVLNGNFNQVATNPWVGAYLTALSSTYNPNWSIGLVAQLASATNSANLSQTISNSRTNINYMLCFKWAAKFNVSLASSWANVYFKGVLIRTIKPTDYLVHY